MISLRNLCIFLILISALSCKNEKVISKKRTVYSEDSKDSLPKNLSSESQQITPINTNNVRVDSVSVRQIKRFSAIELPTIFDYYKEEKTGDYSNWSEKLFGRCCSNTDLRFTDNLFFKITSSFDSPKYPITHLADGQYLTAFAFKPIDSVRIHLQIDIENSFLKGKYSNANLLKTTEMIMNPIRVSLINGYTKSETLFYKNGRVKEMEFYVNNEYKQTVVLLDSPLVQEVTIDGIFTTKDIITLVPKSYYRGSTSDDICISEIQTNLGESGLPELNKKFNLMELINKQ